MEQEIDKLLYAGQVCYVNDDGYMFCNFRVTNGRRVYPRREGGMLRWRARSGRRKLSRKKGKTRSSRKRMNRVRPD